MNDSFKTFKENIIKTHTYIIKTDTVYIYNEQTESLTYHGNWSYSRKIPRSKYEKGKYHENPKVLSIFIAGPDMSPSNLVKKIEKIYIKADYGNRFVKYEDYDFKIQY